MRHERNQVHDPKSRRRAPALLVRAGLAATLGCSIDLGGDDDTGTGSESESDTGYVPTEGIRVRPQTMLQPVPAVVTMEPDADPVPCEADDADVYLCDTTGLALPTVTVRVERDGFEPEVRHPAVPVATIVDLDVHLVPEGGTSGTWSACLAGGLYGDCDAVCGSESGTCEAVACPTQDPEWPWATWQTFTDTECLDSPVDNTAGACEQTLPVGDTEGVRCCCAA